MEVVHTLAANTDSNPIDYNRPCWMSSIHSQVQFSPWLKRVVKRDKVFRMIGKTREAQDMTRSAKKRIALRIMSTSLQAMSIGAKQYEMAIALQEAQKNVKVQPIGFFTTNLDGEDDDPLPVRRLRWGNTDTKLISYDIPFTVSDEDLEQEIVTTERKMKMDQITEIKSNVTSNMLESYWEQKSKEPSS